MQSTSSTPSHSTDRRALLVAATAALLAGCGRKSDRYATIPPGAAVLALGDSLTFGTGGNGESYPARLAQLTGWNVINAGVPSDTSVQARSRLPALLAEHIPVLLLLSIGGNDFLRQLPEADTRAAIAAMLAESSKAGAQPLLIAVPKPTIAGALLRSLDDHPLYEALANEARVPLFASGWALVLSDPALKSDQIHANGEGYARFARELHRFLREAGIAPR